MINLQIQSKTLVRLLQCQGFHRCMIKNSYRLKYISVHLFGPSMTPPVSFPAYNIISILWEICSHNLDWIRFRWAMFHFCPLTWADPSVIWANIPDKPSKLWLLCLVSTSCVVAPVQLSSQLAIFVLGTECWVASILFHSAWYHHYKCITIQVHSSAAGSYNYDRSISWIPGYLRSLCLECDQEEDGWSQAITWLNGCAKSGINLRKTGGERAKTQEICD